LTAKKNLEEIICAKTNEFLSQEGVAKDSEKGDTARKRPGRRSILTTPILRGQAEPSV